ncbi:MAG: ABC transporter permease [Brooklawnia sp.]|jgi:ABC-type lipoprotein release transport system permease subunit
MRWTDLVETSLASLRQRFFRTALTVLGVMIGTMAVVVMISLGIGMTQSMVDSISNNATMTRVEVYPGSAAGDGMGFGTVGQASGQEHVLDSATIAELEQIEGVTRVTPVYMVGAMARVDGTDGWIQLTGLPLDAMADEGFELGQGRLPQRGDGLALLMGSKVHWNFGDGGADGMSFPEIDWLDDQLFITFEDVSATGDPAQATTSPKRVIAPVVGVLAGDDNTFGMDDWSTFVDLDELVTAMRKSFPGKALPGQPATTDGKPKGNEFHYSTLYLKADSVERAESLTAELRQQGYQVSSNVELMREIQQESVVVQAVFGGIGFISLLVAAIGIANTMMMSVYERTKQIGIMKVLGASLRDIRNMFLVESAIIGLIGGLVGLVLSLGLSGILNLTLGASAGAIGAPMKISVIPPYLMIASLAFATLIGTVAGVAPAQRAMNLSPLAAIRSE